MSELMPAPEFSAILITYNQASTVYSAAQSALDALGGRGELICVDDGSSDETASVLEALAAVHDNMQVIRHPHSGRPAVVRNAGLAAARGTWVSFLDGDDLYDRRRFALLAEATARPGFAADFVFHNHRVFVDGTPPSTGLPRITAELEAELFALASGDVSSRDGAGSWKLDGDRLAVFLLARRFVLQTSSFVVRREMLRERQLRFDATRVFGEDNPFMLACVVGSRVSYLRENLTYYRKHPASLTATINPAGHREQLRSLHEQVALLETKATKALSARARAAMRAMLYEATLHQGYLLERSGRSLHAAAFYLRTAARFGSAWAAMLAAKALVRRPRIGTQAVAAVDSRTK